MVDDKGYIQFLHSESHKNDLDRWYRAYNITREKTELFGDFILSLLDLIEDTYLGDDFMESEDDMEKHFMWCFNQIISNFEKEKIFFKNTGLHIEYLWTFFLSTFYKSESEDKIIRIKKYLSDVFVFNYDKSKTDIELLTEFYLILNQNLKN